MAYIPSGAIKAYNNIKSIVSDHFSDRTKTPYVTVDKWFGKITVTIYKDEGKIVHSASIEDVGYLEGVYDVLHQMAFRR